MESAENDKLVFNRFDSDIDISLTGSMVNLGAGPGKNSNLNSQYSFGGSKRDSLKSDTKLTKKGSSTNPRSFVFSSNSNSSKSNKSSSEDSNSSSSSNTNSSASLDSSDDSDDSDNEAKARYGETCLFVDTSNLKLQKESSSSRSTRRRKTVLYKSDANYLPRAVNFHGFGLNSNGNSGPGGNDKSTSGYGP